MYFQFKEYQLAFLNWVPKESEALQRNSFLKPAEDGTEPTKAVVST